jgi:hypothetical protein
MFAKGQVLISNLYLNICLKSCKSIFEDIIFIPDLSIHKDIDGQY